MKEHLLKIAEQGREAVRSNPVELIICLFSSVMSCLVYEKVITGWEGLAYYFPVFFFISYTLNQFRSNKFINWFYAASGLLVIPLVWSKIPEEPYFYLVTLGVTLGIYFISSGQRENTPFVESVLRFMRSVLFSGVLAGITMLLLISIYSSIKYIFEIWETGDDRFFTYAACIVFIVEFPLLFLYFHHDKKDAFTSNKLTEMLLNYVLTPALLVYTVILYLYFVKITILWSLPKGNVALIVIFFSIALFALKGCVPMAIKCPYHWFYNRASWLVLPAQIMFWIGTLYRINEYGFTEARIYLVMAGVVITATTFMFFSNRWGRYLYVITLAVGLFGIVTYIPGITASDLGRMSQERRGPEELKEPAPSFSTEIGLKETIAIDGYKTIDKVYTFKRILNEKDSSIMYISYGKDSLWLYKKGNELVYSESNKVFLEKQLAKAGLTHSDSITSENGAAMMKVDLDSAQLVLQRLYLLHDSGYSITYIDAAFYMHK